MLILVDQTASQTARIEAYLNSRPYITPLVARQVLGVERLASRVWDLRKLGVKLKAVRCVDEQFLVITPCGVVFRIERPAADTDTTIGTVCRSLSIGLCGGTPVDRRIVGSEITRYIDTPGTCRVAIQQAANLPHERCIPSHRNRPAAEIGKRRIIP